MVRCCEQQGRAACCCVLLHARSAGACEWPEWQGRADAASNCCRGSLLVTGGCPAAASQYAAGRARLLVTADVNCCRAAVSLAAWHVSGETHRGPPKAACRAGSTNMLLPCL